MFSVKEIVSNPNIEIPYSFIFFVGVLNFYLASFSYGFQFDPAVVNPEIRIESTLHKKVQIVKREFILIFPK